MWSLQVRVEPITTPTEQAGPTQTVALPTPTALQQIPATPLAPTATTPVEQSVSIFLIALENNGRSGILVGCGDSAIPINVSVPRTQGVLRAALEKLLTARQQLCGESGYYNALSQSDLQVAGVTIEDGRGVIHLTETLVLGGACDAPRIEAQIEQTALQFSTVRDVAVLVNGIALEEALSTR